MHDIKIDFKEFLRQHYWLGFYFWNDCDMHKHYNSKCILCNAGEWRRINTTVQSDGHRTNKSPPYDDFKIFKMPMNNVKWHNEDDKD